jgi:hypothetical protein
MNPGIRGDVMKRSALPLLAIMMFCMGAVDRASAQVCLGRPSFKAAPTNVSLSADFTKGVKTISGGLGFGNNKAFGAVGAGYVSYSDFDASAVAFNFAAGLSIPVSNASRVRICPIAQFSYVNGPTEESILGTLKITSLGLLGGVAIGGAVPVSPGFSVIPNARAGVLYRHSSASLGGDLGSKSETGGLLSGGVSLFFGTNFTLEPSVSIPLGFNTSDPIFSIGMTVAFKSGP